MTTISLRSPTRSIPTCLSISSAGTFGNALKVSVSTAPALHICGARSSGPTMHFDQVAARLGWSIGQDMALGRHPRKLLSVLGNRVLRRVELHAEKGVVTHDAGQVDHTLGAEARLGAFERRIRYLFVLQ